MKFLLAVGLAALLAPLAAFASDVCVCRYCEQLRLAAEQEDQQALAASRYAPDRVVDVRHIKIDVTPDFDARSIEAETTLTFAPISRAVQEVTLDAVDLRIESVTSTAALAEHHATDEKLSLLFEQPLPVGEEVSVTVRYAAEPKQGLYFRTAGNGYPEADTHLWTKGEPHEARHWFPSFDYPNERSTTEVICHVPADMRVLSNGRRLEDRVDGGLRTSHWRMEKSHVSYLVCLVAGRFDKLDNQIGDLPLGFYSQPTLSEYAANSFADTADIIRFFNDEIGVPFPWNKYDQVTIRDFTAGGMENTTLTTLTHRTLFSRDTEQLFSTRNLDAHETAHQWFGDYVTCEDWSNLWLNEGFATFYTHLYDEHRFGRDERLYRLHRDASTRILNQRGDTRPIVYRGYKMPYEQFDFRAYPKGAWVLHMLRERLGKDVYRRGVKKYLEKHALKSVVTADLVAELEDASGLELDRFFDQWVYHGGTPDLEIGYTWLAKEKLARVTVKQTHEVSDDVPLFHMLTKLRFTVGEQTIDREIDIRDAEHEFYVSLPARPSVVRFDPEYTVLAEVDFDKPRAMLEAQLAHESDMMGRLLAAIALGAKEGDTSIAALQTALQTDAHYGVRIEAAKALGKLASDVALAALIDSLDQPDARARKAVVAAIGGIHLAAADGVLLRIASEEKNPGIAGEAVYQLGARQSPDARAAIVRALATPTLHEDLAIDACRAAGRRGDATLAKPIVAMLAVRGQDIGARAMTSVLTTLAKLAADADDKQAVRDYLVQTLTGDRPALRVAVITALGELADPTTLPLLRARMDHPNAKIAAAATKAVKRIEEHAPSTPAEVQQLRQLVRELESEQKKLRKAVNELEAKANAG